MAFESDFALSASSIVAVGVDRDAPVYGKARVAEVSALGYRTGETGNSVSHLCT